MNTSIAEIEKLVIIGSGPAGLTAAIYGARASLNPIIIEGKEPGGQLMGTSYVENWPGEERITGPALMLKMRQHAIKFGTRFILGQIVEAQITQNPFVLTTYKQVHIKTQALIIATGATPKRLNCPGEQEYWGRGVTTCAVCDGALYKNKRAIIVGGGDTAMESAVFMTNFTDKITIVHILPHFTASQAMQQKVLLDKRINILYQSTVTEIIGKDAKVVGVIVTNQETNQKRYLEADIVFIAIGLTPNSSLFKGQLEIDSYGYIKLQDRTRTSVAGVFAAGDVADSYYKQAITAAGSGCAALLDAERYLKHGNS